MDLLYTLAALCYSAVLLSSSSFLVDFIGIRFTRPRLVVSLHISTGAYLDYLTWKCQAFIKNVCKILIKGQVAAVMCGAVLVVSGACLYVIKENVQKGRTSLVWSTTSAPPGGMSTLPGESFYIEILALFFSLMASIFSYICSPESLVPTQFYSVEHEDRERECLITEPGPDDDEWDD
ncbi:hypothetical protein C0J50_0395 [Silurus asotus]|uniref:Uncharacterized protein n=1 Tax=Silurus asotus TaxID=30991 RepID=A0AAD5AH67_SILAS|nr:hypothetical protein C0J50_0395 [Silurus asotus]